MYQYIDCHGNAYQLSSDGQGLRYVSAGAAPEGAAATQRARDTVLSDERYMQIVSAFVAAIDNRLQHRELCNKCSGTILATVDGQQRRYILSGQSRELQELEETLQQAITT